MNRPPSRRHTGRSHSDNERRSWLLGKPVVPYTCFRCGVDVAEAVDGVEVRHVYGNDPKTLYACSSCSQPTPAEREDGERRLQEAYRIIWGPIIDDFQRYAAALGAFLCRHDKRLSQEQLQALAARRMIALLRRHPASAESDRMRDAWYSTLDLIASRHADDPALLLDANLSHELDRLDGAGEEETPSTG